MADVLSFTEALERRDGPDVEHVWRDGSGVKWFRFAFSYDFEGREFVVEVWARDRGDADARLEALRATGRVDGQVYATVFE